MESLSLSTASAYGRGVEFRVLGPLEVLDDGRPLPIGGPKQRAVLAHLILQPNRIVPAERLIEDVWGEEPPETARNVMQSYVSRLRKLLGDGRIEGRGAGYVLSVAPEEIDRLGHVNNLAYVAWMQAAAVAHSSAQGWNTERYEELGMAWVVRSHQIKYLQSAYAGDEVTVITWVAEFKRVSTVRRYKVIRRSDGALLASAATEWAFVDFQTGTLTRIPTEVATAFELVAEGT